MGTTAGPATRARGPWTAACFAFIALGFFLGSDPASAQHGATDGEWRTWAGDLGATRRVS